MSAHGAGVSETQVDVADAVDAREVRALRTIDDGDGSLSRLIEDLCRLHVPSSMSTEVRLLGSEFPTTHEIEHELLRIAGEALANAARH